MKVKFEIDETKWNFVDEVGLPQNDEWCIVIWKSIRGYDYHMGSYFKKSNEFYVNFGYGGAVLGAENVIAWAPLFENDDYLKVNG